MSFVDKEKNLKKLQTKELEILKYFHQFCEENNIKYTLAYGTLLGAVRHQGFIPWDDDVDVFVSGQDYLKLIELSNKINNDKYTFQSLETEPNYYLLWNKIRMNNTTFVEKGWEKNKINNGIFIDIFPLLEQPNEKESKKISRILTIMKLAINNNLVVNYRYKYYGKSGKILSNIIKLIPKKLRNKYVIKNIRKLCEFKSNKNSFYSLEKDLEEIIENINFNNRILLPFEDTELYCPKEYDKLLTIQYGDYMKLPDPKERVGHGEVYLSFDEAINEK